jgi:DNA-binding winged helix-turn-helix (wHTH) protein
MNDPTGLWSTPVRTRFALGDLVLDLHRGTLLDAQGAPLQLRPQAWAVLEHLARNAGRVVSREELFDAVWPGLVVTDGSIAQAISDVRTALGDTAHRTVKTVQRRGYMLLADAIAEDSMADVDVAAAHETEARASKTLDVAVSPEAQPRHADAEQTLRFGRVEVSPQQRRLRIDGADASVGGRAFDLLVALMERRHRVVSRNELFDLVWPGRVVDDHNAAAQVLALRKLLGADAIATVPGRGYRFTLSSSDEGSSTPPVSPAGSVGRDRFALPAPRRCSAATRTSRRYSTCLRSTAMSPSSAPAASARPCWRWPRRMRAAMRNAMGSRGSICRRCRSRHWSRARWRRRCTCRSAAAKTLSRRWSRA